MELVCEKRPEHCAQYRAGSEARKVERIEVQKMLGMKVT